MRLASSFINCLSPSRKGLIMKAKLFLAIAMLVPLTAANAAELATSDRISKAVSDNTVQGSMDASGAYTEYYEVGGVVHGKDYKAKWSVENNTMCWVYEGAEKDCWNVAIKGNKISWIKDDKSQGTGTILPGNPNKF